MEVEEVEKVEAPPILCGIPQAAALLGRGERFVYEAIATGKIIGLKSDRRALVLVSSLHDYVATLHRAKIKPLTKRRRIA